MKRQTKFGLVLAAAAVISVTVASLVCARGWVQNGADWYYVDSNNEYVTETIQSSGNAKFYLNENGAMVRDYFLEDYNDNTYYFGSNGAMVTNTWVAVDSSLVENQEDYVPDNYWYYFQASGKAVKGSSETMKKLTIDGKKYGFNEYGQMSTGWCNLAGKTINPDDESNPFANAVYYAGGDNDGVLRAGWVSYYDGYDGDGTEYQSEYNTLYFYFNTSNNRKYGVDSDGNGEVVSKKINGRTYVFNDEGIMVSGWDVHNYLTGIASRSSTPRDGILTDKVVYFSGQDDGHQVKKGWVYAVPAEDIDESAYKDDEEKYMYFASSGDIVKDQFKKINGKFYAFNQTGIMKTGVVVWCPDGVDSSIDTKNGYKFVATLDLDWAEGSEVAKKGILRYDSKAEDFIQVNTDGLVLDGGTGNTGMLANRNYVKLHLFGDDGARKVGVNNVEFADDTYQLATNASGDKGSGAFAKKYYSLGIVLKASSDIRYGIYHNGTPSNVIDAVGDYTVGDPLYAQHTKNDSNMTEYFNNLQDSKYLVLTTSGSKQKGNNTAKKDSDGNYWFIRKDEDTLAGIWTVNIKSAYTVSKFNTRPLRRAFVANTLGSVPANINSAQLIQLGLATEAYTGGGSWTTVEDGGNVYFYKAIENANVFQSDYGNGSNKWIPFGMTDNSGKTVTFNLTAAQDRGDDKALAYVVKPNDDYFLNCYWNTAR